MSLLLRRLRKGINLSIEENKENIISKVKAFLGNNVESFKKVLSSW